MHLKIWAKRPRFVWALVAIIMSFVVISCNKGNEPAPEDDLSLQQEIGSITGLGEVGGTPQGTAYKLPDGVSIEGDIIGGGCSYDEEFIGSGVYVDLCIGLRNDTDRDVTITFPGGLIFISDTDEYQNGVVLESTTIVLPSKKTTKFTFYTYCGNAGRSSSSSSGNYTFGPVTNSKLVKKLVEDLKVKKIAAAAYMDGDYLSSKYYEVEETVQSLLWLITDGSEYMDWTTFEHMYKQYLEELPNK